MAEKPLTDSINALTEYINEVTGETDDNLSDAVATLAEGYESGGFSVDDIALQKNLGDVLLKDTTKNIEASGFSRRKLKSITALEVRTISSSAFEESTVEQAYLPKVTTFGTATFRNCKQLTQVNAPSLLSVSIQGFLGCSALTSVNIPSVKSLSAQAFRSCNSLQILKLPSCTGIGGGNNFLDCANLTDVYLPNAASSYTGAPWGATNATIHYNTTFDENGEPVIE